MSSRVQSFQKRTLLPSSMTVTATSHALPVSQSDSETRQGQGLGLRRRLSSLSFKIQSTSTSWASQLRSKSTGQQAGDYIRKWCYWGWSWILSRKPVFAKDLELNEEDQTKMLESHNRGSWMYVFLKVRSEIRKLVRSDKVGLPQTYRYDSVKYSKN
uniref:Uncharacterized protein LOC107423372 n=1 Tax=Rhizophora mucronata TaxID=61149 RepID=A0A2P2Q3R0_RHIMU